MTCTVLMMLFLLEHTTKAQAQADTTITSRDIQEITITDKRRTPPMRLQSDGTTKLSTKFIDELPKILGNSDPMRYMQMMPGVQVNGEYDSGIHIQGSDNSHNYVSIDGVPIYNPSHLLGFFSVFNPGQFSAININRSANSAMFPNRMGGQVNMEGDENVQSIDSIQGSADIGLISSQGTIKIPIKGKQAIIMSARLSYINLLYSNWLKMDEGQLSYGFNDINLRYITFSNWYHEMWIDLYYGQDHASTEGQFGINLEWGNEMASLHYRRKGRTKINNTLYASRYHSYLNLSINDYNGELPSGITTTGLKTDLLNKWMGTGISMQIHHMQPQSPKLNVMGQSTDNSAQSFNCQEHSAYMELRHQNSRQATYSIGVRGCIFIDRDKNMSLSIDPNAYIRKPIGDGSIQAGYAIRHQNIFLSGFTSSGLPTEFWYASHKDMKSQYAHEFSVHYQGYLSGDRYAIEAETYYKIMRRQLEYNGSMMDLIMSNYEVENHLLCGQGYNYGLSAMIQKRYGKLRGWISYTYGRARRQFQELGSGYYPANHDRPHELNTVCTYHINNRWQLGGIYVYASGTPFTAPKWLYMVNGNLMTEYGDHNTNRLKAYTRMDLSANYTFRTKGCGVKQGLNFSIYNVFARANDLFYAVKYWNDKFKYHHITFLIRTLPNISYYIKF